MVRDGLVSLTYRNNIYRPEDPAAQKSEENYISPRITYWFDIRNGVSLEYGLTFGNFELSPDLTEQVARGRYTYRFNPRTSIFGEYAFDTVNFEKPGVDYYVQTPSLGYRIRLQSNAERDGPVRLVLAISQGRFRPE